jgi:hypothetical protein
VLATLIGLLGDFELAEETGGQGEPSGSGDDPELARIDVAERALISELEAPADPANPATAAYRARTRHSRAMCQL